LAFGPTIGEAIGRLPRMSVPYVPSLCRATLRPFVALCLLVGTCGQAQTIPAFTPAAEPVRSTPVNLRLWAVPVRRNPLQADPKSIAAFLRPWLFTSRLLDWGFGPISERSTRSIPKPQSYRLTPDPFNWTLNSTSPDEDDLAYLPDLPRVGYRNTAQRLADAGREIRHPVHRVDAKYDVTRIGDRDVGQGINFFSLEKEVALGRELSGAVEQSVRLLADPVVNEYVNHTGQLLVQHSDCKIPFIIKVIDDDEVNAFALPGGFFYVNTGVILAADDEAELAGVMAHEIAHVCARHATRNLTKEQITQYASLPLVFFGGPVGYALRQVSGFVMPISALKFSRDAEREADLLGIEYQYAAGYDPTAFVDFFEKLESEGKEPHSFISRAFMTHPMTADRVRRAEETLETLPDRDSYITDSSDFDEVRDRVSRLTHGRSFRGGERPHPTLRRRSGTD